MTTRRLADVGGEEVLRHEPHAVRHAGRGGVLRRLLHERRIELDADAAGAVLLRGGDHDPSVARAEVVDDVAGLDLRQLRASRRRPAAASACRRRRACAGTGALARLTRHSGRTARTRAGSSRAASGRVSFERSCQQAEGAAIIADTCVSCSLMIVLVALRNCAAGQARRDDPEVERALAAVRARAAAGDVDRAVLARRDALLRRRRHRAGDRLDSQGRGAELRARRIPDGPALRLRLRRRAERSRGADLVPQGRRARQRRRRSERSATSTRRDAA